MSQQHKQNPAAEQITDFGDLYPRQVAHHRFSVLNLTNDPPTAYQVNTDELECDCGDATYNQDDGQVCKHLAAALYQAPTTFTFEEDIVADLARTQRDVMEAAHAADDAADALEGALIQARDAEAGAASNGDTGGSDDGSKDDNDGVVHEIDATDDESELAAAVKDWVASAEQFNADIDPAIVECKWAEADGKEGVWVDRAPFYNDARYYDDGWQDQDGYETARDAVGDLLSNNDAFEWFGEPDYAWFATRSAVEELVE